VDIFCGAGGLAHGFRQEGFQVAAGVDIDEGCRYAFEHNNAAPFVRKDIGSLSSGELASLFHRGGPRILVGCAPCQPFSMYNQKNDDPKWRLVDRFAELVRSTLPDIVSMENVPRLLAFQEGKVFKSFLETLKGAGYRISYRVVYLPAYGVPQRRSRLVLLASRHGEIKFEEPTVQASEYQTVAEAIGGLPPIGAGGVDPGDALHRASRLSKLNLQRIKASKPGGSWKDWDDHLIAQCHKIETGRGYGSVYGRMRGDQPSPTITTQFYGFGNGRFGHPTQDRALSLREGALLQSFPREYAFVAPNANIQYKRVGRMIGNAVPVALGRVIARSIRRHLAEHQS
jgi:DNA (cytosine-5)-methyltransferase 1